MMLGKSWHVTLYSLENKCTNIISIPLKHIKTSTCPPFPPMLGEGVVGVNVSTLPDCVFTYTMRTIALLHPSMEKFLEHISIRLSSR